MSTRNVIPEGRIVPGLLTDHAQQLRTLARRKVGVETFAEAVSRIGDLETRADVAEAFMALWSEKFVSLSGLGVASDATGATYQTWGPGTSVTIPEWATIAVVNVTVTPVKPISNVSNTFIRLAIGSAVSSARVIDIGNSAALNNDFSYAVLHGVTLDPTEAGTTVTMHLEAQRNSGTGALRMSTSTFVGYYIEFR